MASILYLRLDSSYDPVFEPSAELSDLEAVRQAVQTRILLFEGEWWENLNEGTPMFQLILGYRQFKGNQQVAALAITKRIMGTPYVSSVSNILVGFDPVKRRMTFTATVITTFGTFQITMSPGSAAGTVNN
jgi:hypothetical protein